MALTSTGVVKTVLSDPFLVKTCAITVAAGSNGDITHGQSIAPDLVFVRPTSNAGTAAFSIETAPTSGSETTKLNCVARGNGTDVVGATIVMVFFSDPGTGGLYT